MISSHGSFINDKINVKLCCCCRCCCCRQIDDDDDYDGDDDVVVDDCCCLQNLTNFKHIVNYSSIRLSIQPSNQQSTRSLLRPSVRQTIQPSGYLPLLCLVRFFPCFFPGCLTSCLLHEINEKKDKNNNCFAKKF